jgi:uncharacterized protein YjbJ (UPF0337 family)
MNKDELREKAEQLKGRAKEALGAGAKQAEGFIERMKDKLGKGKREEPRQDRPASREEDDDE